MPTHTQSQEIDDLIASIHKSFRILLQNVDFDQVRYRRRIECEIAQILANRDGWSTVEPGHFVFMESANLFIDPASPPNTAELIIQTAQRVLAIELESLILDKSARKSKMIRDAVTRLVSENDWQIYFTRKRLDQTSSC